MRYPEARQALQDSLSFGRTECDNILAVAFTSLNLPRICNEVAGNTFLEKHLITFSRALGVLAALSATSLVGAIGLEEQVTFISGVAVFGAGAIATHVEGMKVAANALGSGSWRVNEKLGRNPGTILPNRPCSHERCRNLR